MKESEGQLVDFDAVDALLAAVTVDGLPEPEERRRLRRAARLNQQQVATAVGVSRETVSAWETGRWEPTGQARAKYLRLLEGLRARLNPPAATPNQHDTATPQEALPAQTAEPTLPGTVTAKPDENAKTPPAPRPCVLCGKPATYHVEGFPQHLDPAECITATPTTPPPVEPPTAQQTAPEPARRAAPSRQASQEPAVMPDMIGQAVQQALADNQGDGEAAAAALLRRAIPDAMALLDVSRIGARYDLIGHPPLPDVLRKKTSRGADAIWEARPRWTRGQLPAGTHEVTALDINGAYLSALKTHLPLGALEHSFGNIHSGRRSGIHLITPPEWTHDAYLPNPLGSREEPGPLWVTEPTLRLLQRLASDKYGRLCEPPVIHESFTSGSTEHLFEKFRQVLRDAREKAIVENDETTLEYVKAMYSKFVSTMGESNFNREIYRPDWMHIIRSQAFVNLWLKAHKAHTVGLTVVRAMGTDELHVTGNWREVFTEGRGVTEVKVKDVYTVGSLEQ